MKRESLLHPPIIAFAASLSLLALACGPTVTQQATLVALSVKATLTAAANPFFPTAPAEGTAPPATQAVPATASGLSNQGYALATQAINWKRTKYDPLDRNLFGWCDEAQPSVGSDGSSSRFFFNQGVYEVIFKTGDTGASRWCAPYGTYYDFSASIKTLLADADPSAYYGLIFRVYQQSYSSLIGIWLTPDGKYYIGAFDQHGNYVSLKARTDASGLQANGQWNQLTVDAQGSVFTFFINDLFLTQLTYDSGSTAKGSIGVSVGVSSPRRSIDVKFSDLEIREP